MNSIESEIVELEEQLRQAELAPNASFFEKYLADDAVLLDEKGMPSLSKHMIVDAHKPSKGQKFIDVQMSEMKIRIHDLVAIVTCTGTYTTKDKTFTLKFMRVWVKKKTGWHIIAATISK